MSSGQNLSDTPGIFKLADAESGTNAVHMVGTQQAHAKMDKEMIAVAFLGWEAQPPLMYTCRILVCLNEGNMLPVSVCRLAAYEQKLKSSKEE